MIKKTGKCENHSLLRHSINFKAFAVPENTKKPHQTHWHLGKKTKLVAALAIIFIIALSSPILWPKSSQNSPIIAVSNQTPTSTPTLTATSSPSPTPQATSNVNNPPSQPKNTANPENDPPIVLPTPTPHPPGVVTSATSINSSTWQAIATNAWQYYQQGVGIDPGSGLPYAEIGFTGFTDWDLGGYIQAIVDAGQIGLIGTTGPWGSYSRLNTVLTFLETRQLNNYSYPYQFYNAINGQPDLSDSCNETVDICDTGKLLVALENTLIYSQENNLNLTKRIDDFVYNVNGNGSDYGALVPEIESDMASSTSIYSYYMDSGFGYFFPQVADASTLVMNNILNQLTITTYDVTLPNATILEDPLLLSVFELNNNDSRLMALCNETYLAAEANYDKTGKFIAYSEGSSLSDGYIYEWVVGPDGQPWEITNGTLSSLDITPAIYTKVAFSFLALYNTTYARNMLVYLENALPMPVWGYSDGINYNTSLDPGSNTNSLILDAAAYFIQENP
jgi:hypothetical protein